VLQSVERVGAGSAVCRFITDIISIEIVFCLPATDRPDRQRPEQWQHFGIIADDAFDLILAHRRHLNTSQRGMVAARITNLKSGQRSDEMGKNSALQFPCAGFEPVTCVQAAKRLNGTNASSSRIALLVLSESC
jgi:hypothetical protein